ncbi:3-isopropylmalate dehydratase small subunit [Sphingomonas sp. PL-96]|uniref:3-isopropylmalate dehydratase small subunit n=1 Tax=Sphingomonas sp. PL-96 TaxID=2887201 RepID=UPI001E55F778|nr:3-isopropylmalate dehydratase small subunit [Sphingomonas sp. PL-96]MCC2976547.1 3-isopropylmalate dehydratase small subunit [Sphingomonas sp. PL-96]
MTPLTRVTGQALSLPQADIDTDIIYPARFLLITERTGLGAFAFYDRRNDPAFPIAPDLRKVPPFLVAGPNFGCGSSREQAPWALDDLGVRVIIAESFGEIFYSNCFKNGMLPIRLDTETVTALHASATSGGRFTVDLLEQRLRVDGLPPLAFDVAPAQRAALLNGWSEITRIQSLHGNDIASFEAAQRRAMPWLW